MTSSINTSTDLSTGGGGQWTAREIAQQPDLWRQVARSVAERREITGEFLSPLLTRGDLRIVLTGAGTSAFAGQILAPGLTRELRRRVEAIPTTDLVSNPGEHFAEDVPTLLVSFARSGDSPESTASTRLADQFLSECHHLVLTCNGDGELARSHADAARSLVLVMPAAANDRGFAMTSSFSCMLLTALMTLGRSGPEAAGVQRLAAAADAALAEFPSVTTTLAKRGFARIVFLGSGPLTGLARESALKMLELSAGQVATWFDSSLGFRHGPKSVLDDSTLVVVYVSTDPYTSRYDRDMVRELREAMPPGSVVVVTAGSLAGAAESSDHAPTAAPDTWNLSGLTGFNDAAVSLVFVICAQLLALAVSLASGRTPDNPFPSREVNRVVQGVTVHPYPGAG